nr:MAG TPA: DNA pilot protein VP2 [Microviridae sp.]
MINFIFRDVGSTSVLQRPHCRDLASSLISGAGHVIGGLFSSGGSRYAADKQLQAVQETNRNNLLIAQQNNAFNERMWNKQNEYNSPTAQRARLEAAGLNPYLMLDGGSAGIAESAPSADTSGTQVAPDIGNTIAGGYQAIGNSISAAASQIAQQVYQNDLQQANVDKTKAEAQNADLQNQYDSLRNEFAAANFLVNLRLKQKQGDISEYEANYLRDSMEDRLQSAHFDWQLKGNQSSYYENLAGLTDIQRQIQKVNLDWLPREKQVGLAATLQNIRSMVSQMHLNYAQAKSAYAMAILNYAQANGVRIDNRLKDSTFDLSVGMAENQYLKGYAEQDQYRRGLNLSAFQYGAALHSQSSIPTPKPPRKAKSYKK